MIRAVLALALMTYVGIAHATSALRYGAPPPPGIGGEVDLVDETGARFSFRNLQGEPALVFFGFTRCGSTCPIAMMQAKQVLADFAHKTTPNILLVTLDPLSDKPSELKRYLDAIDTRLRGLTGKPEAVGLAAERFGVGQRRQAGGELEHSSVWYLVNSEGQVLRVYPLSTPATHLARDLRAARSLTSVSQ